ncbi:MAG: type VI secretion system baseplate subunit TssK [Burkholderiaceae bacterium]|nr:type VI secretion system baseplate subunit TssK [Burkholderiaceae bacterium]
MWRNKVLWTEGLFLRPQHLQQQERYFENLVDRRSRAAFSWGWGFETLELDDGALSMGKVAIRSASGVLPDGTAFACPADDLPPAPLEIPVEMKDRRIYLAIALDRAGVQGVSLGEGDAQMLARCVARDAEVPDNVQGFDESAPMQLGALKLALLAQDDLSGAYAAMPLAKVIERRTDGQVLLETQFVAPTLSTNDAATVRGWLGEIRGLLRQRVEALASRMAQPGRGGVAEVADFLLLQLVNRYCATTDHLSSVPRLHPERLYATFVELAGELASFGAERRLARAFPAYDHDDLQATFRPVLEQLRLALSMVLEQNAIPIELHDRKYGVRVAVIADKSLLANASFVLAVNAQLPSEALRLRFPTQVKIGPVEKIRDLVNLQLPGVPIRALAVAPRQIPFHAGFNYFELDTRHDLWRMLDKSGGLAMHVSGDFPGIELEFWAIRG